MNERGFIMPTAIWLTFLLTVMGSAAIVSTRINLKISSNYKNHTKAFYIAEAATQYAKKTLAFTDSNPITWSSSSFLGAQSTNITITPDSVNPDLTVISATSDINRSISIVELKLEHFMPLLSGVLGGVTSSGPVAVNGTLNIDGRDHDLSCNPIPGTGIQGIYTNATFSQGGSAEVGGHDSGTDYPPVNPGDSTIITSGGTEAVDTPDAVIGIVEGTLKSIAQSGIDGSQYVTDPSTLTLPLQGVTYVELPSGDTWTSQNMLTGGSGVLIVHNSDTNAILENTNGGTFTGLVITDDLVHLHNDIIGALVTLTSNPSAGNVLGNGTGSVCYSTMALNNLTFLKQIREIAWKEI